MAVIFITLGPRLIYVGKDVSLPDSGVSFVLQLNRPAPYLIMIRRNDIRQTDTHHGGLDYQTKNKRQFTLLRILIMLSTI